MWLRTKLQWHLFQLGRFVQRHAGKVLFVGLLVLSTFCVGLKSATVQTDVEKLWVEGTSLSSPTRSCPPPSSSFWLPSQHANSCLLFRIFVGFGARRNRELERTSDEFICSQESRSVAREAQLKRIAGSCKTLCPAQRLAPPPRHLSSVGAGCRSPLPARRVPVAGCRVPVAGCRSPGAGRRVPVAGCRSPGAGSTPDNQRNISQLWATSQSLMRTNEPLTVVV